MVETVLHDQQSTALGLDGLMRPFPVEWGKPQLMAAGAYANRRVVEATAGRIAIEIALAANEDASAAAAKKADDEKASAERAAAAVIKAEEAAASAAGAADGLAKEEEEGAGAANLAEAKVEKPSVETRIVADASLSQRVALVIGNNDYSDLPKLEKAVNDARAVGSALKDIGFGVLSGEISAAGR